MTSTNLEKLRMMYQDIEDHRKQSVKLLMNPPKTIKEEAYHNHHFAQHCKTIQELSSNILQSLNEGFVREEDPVSAFYAELDTRIQFHTQVADIERKTKKNEHEQQEIETNMNDLVLDIRGTPHLNLFYDNDRFQEWKRQNKSKLGNKKAKKHQIVIPENDEALTKFSGEECYGKFLDLNTLHHEFLTLNITDNISYIQFIQYLIDTNFSNIPKTPQGEKFLINAFEYLSSFITRKSPFFNINEALSSIKQSFEQSYKNSQSMSQYKCELCSKDFESEDQLNIHLNQQSHKRNVKKADKAGGYEQFIAEKLERQKHFAELSFTVKQLLLNVNSVLNSTLENAKRRQTLTADVMRVEQNSDAPIVFDESDDEEEQHFYNPKGLPLGWDGNPIPYWLYKLHGLSVEYKCEICGNRSYWGAAAFEKHFLESRHINGLKALAIPPTRHFLYVTGVTEAIALYDKIRKTLQNEVWQPGEEEIETDDGNVMNLKIYQDLVRQGFIKPKQNK